MKIMFITELFWGAERKLGQEYVLGTTAIYDLAKNWTKENEVICFREMPLGWKRWILNKIKYILGYKNIYDAIPLYYEGGGVKIYSLKYLWYPHRAIIGKLLYKRFANKINMTLKSINWKPDVIVAHMPTMNAMFYIENVGKNVPKIAVLHRGDLSQLCKDGKVVKNKVHLLEKNFDRVFSRSQVIYKSAKGMGLSNLTNDIVPSGIILNLRDNRNWKNIKERKINILYAGSLIKQKGIQQILKAVAQLADKYVIELCIIGEGIYEKNLKRLTHNLQIENYVNFVGKKPKEIVYDHMNKADIFIMPSYHETLGLVYLEAMSSGCITIGSRREGIDGIIVHGENGYLVDPHNLKEITECIEKVINMPEKELAEISNKAVNTSMYYNETSISEQYLNLIKKSVGE